jgi:group I intron endonuclease
MLIYCAENVINRKRYIGKTVGALSDRITRHLCAVRKGRENVYFHNAIRKHGESNFRWSILCECSSVDELSKMEKHYIGLCRSNDANYGYNLTVGGEGCEGYRHTKANKNLMAEQKKGMYVGEKNPMFGKHHLAETKRKLSETKAGSNHPFYGKPRSEITRKRIGDSNKGKVITAETRKKLSDALRGKLSGANNPNFGKAPFLGKKHSPETKERMRHAALLRRRNERGVFLRATPPTIERRPYDNTGSTNL